MGILAPFREQQFDAGVTGERRRVWHPLVLHGPNEFTAVPQPGQQIALPDGMGVDLDLRGPRPGQPRGDSVGDVAEERTGLTPTVAWWRWARGSNFAAAARTSGPGVL